MRTKQGAIGKDFGKVMSQIKTIEEQLRNIACNASAACLVLSKNETLTQDLSESIKKLASGIIVDASTIQNMLRCYSEMEE